MQVSGVRANLDGSFELVQVQLTKGAVSLEPDGKSWHGYCSCYDHDKGAYIGSQGPEPPIADESCFILFYQPHSHTLNCKAPVHKYTHYLDASCGCGVEEKCDHLRVPLLFLKCARGRAQKEHDFSLKGQMASCRYRDCTEDDLLGVQQEIQKRCANVHSRHPAVAFWPLCTVL